MLFIKEKIITYFDSLFKSHYNSRNTRWFIIN